MVAGSIDTLIEAWAEATAERRVLMVSRSDFSHIFLLLLITLYSELPPLTAVAILLVIVEVWVVFHVYWQSSALLPLTIYLCHSANLLLFSTVYMGYLEVKADISEDSKLPRAEAHLRDGALLEDMIILRGMERGLLLWDGNGTVFVPWMNLNSLTERANEADSRR